MKALKTIAFICYLIVGLMGLLFAFFYLTRQEFMPYHSDAVGMRWEDVSPHVQVLIIALMRVSGGGWLATSIGIFFMLVARRKYETMFFRFALLLIALSALIPTLIATLYVKNHSPANPPWIAAAIGIALISTGLLLDWIAFQKNKRLRAS